MGMISYDLVLYNQFYDKYFFLKRYAFFDTAGGIKIKYLYNV